MSDPVPQLQVIAHRLESQEASTPEVLRPEDVSLLFDSFLPSSIPSSRSLTYIILAKFCSIIRQKAGSGNAPDPVATIFRTELDSRLSATKAEPVTSALGFLHALFQVDSTAAATLFAQPETTSSLEDIPEIFADSSSPVLRPLASLLAQAASNATCRTLIDDRGKAWLTIQSRQTRDPQLRAAAAVALTKLVRGTPNTSLESQTKEVDDTQKLRKEEEALLQVMSNLVISGSTDAGVTDNNTSLVDSIEGLTHLSAASEHKDVLARDTDFLEKIFALVPVVSSSSKASAQLRSHYTEVLRDNRDNTVLLFGIASIINNLASYRPPRSQTDRAIEQLRRTATPGAKLNALPIPVDDPAEADSAVAARAQLLLEAGVLPALSALAQSTSIGVRRAAGSAYLGLVTAQSNRGKAIQGGAVKALLHISQRATYDRPPPSTATPSTNATSELTPGDLLALQALAKLAITHPPNLLFGPTPRAAIGPLSNLLTHHDASTLQQFEALMALTNIATVDAEGVVKGTGIRHVEDLMLADHKMVRRASVELLCNLVGSDDVWTRYTGEGDAEAESGASKAIQSRLHVLMALSDVDDLPTRRAASGALAMLTSSAPAVNSLLGLERGPSRLTQVVRELVLPSDDTQDDDDEGEDSPPQEHDSSLTLRGATIARNMLHNSAPEFKVDLISAAQETGLLAALLEIVQGEDETSKRSAAEALVWIGRARGQIPPA
ncbi:ARM repeat-containing protein [Ceratobasidium sp. AG-I]|nr:ARM repeat-containing protein [Ceratobasidium sp. AG-I]